MRVRLHPHAAARIAARGATEAEVVAAVESGENFPAKHGRVGFRRNFTGQWIWRQRAFDTKQLEVYAVGVGDDWLVITTIVKYF